MKRTFVDSTSITSVGYDLATHTLEIEFGDGGIYHYLNVPPIVHRDLMNAASKGSYFAHFIKTTYTCTKVQSAK